MQNPILLHLEPYASSASELVTEMFQYVVTEKKSIGKLEAEVLLAGITVDTKSFSVKTGVRTFDAASWLRRQGADTAEVRQFFQIDMELSRQEAQIVSAAEILPVSATSRNTRYSSSFAVIALSSSNLAPSLERAHERRVVGKFQMSAHGDAVGQAGDLYPEGL